MIRDPLALAGLITAVTALGFWLEGRFAWARLVGSSLLIILFGAVLSNLDLVAASSPVYGVITGPVTSLAIVWLLLAVNLRDVWSAGPRMLSAFAVAVAATCCGALTAALIFGGAFPGDLWRLAGVMTGTYAGGSLNFVAMGREVGLSDNLFAAATAADNVVTALWMGATLVLPLRLALYFPARPSVERRPDSEGSSEGDGEEAGHPFLKKVVLEPFDFLAMLTLGFVFLLAADTLS